ncbi:MAG TPA: hypothetical protein VGO68_11030 [Pyrinomonadaceae bacterium]|jgi:hypothetical protein|nr:hypothetical protein [Pyrinomonadaceae bacterium]
MRRLQLTAVFCVVSLVLAASQATPATHAMDQDSAISWNAKMHPGDSRYLVVSVTVRNGFCVKPYLTFTYDYIDQWGWNRTFSGYLSINGQTGGRVCEGTFTYNYLLAYSAKSLKNGLMHFTAAPKGPRPAQ